jgi:four helix bundle protein
MKTAAASGGRVSGFGRRRSAAATVVGGGDGNCGGGGEQRQRQRRRRYNMWRFGMFMAYEVSLDAIRCLAAVVPQIAARDGPLADQLRRAASSVPLNIAEGRRRAGAARTNFYRIAAGSAAEALAALDTALAWGYADAKSLAQSRATLDRLLGMLYPLTR